MSDDLTPVSIERRDGESLALVLSGDVDIYCAAALRESAETLLQEQADIVVACEGLSHLDTSALQVLLALRRELNLRGRSLRLSGVSSAVAGILQLAGVDAALDCRAAASRD